ncbi:MAG: tetratricopeptide repeat protein [Anaerolineaceae bacterium]|nr:tetratricopeptide repeat protein [Anaerolineaceae bacterium]MCB9098564.1 tetratricopeptide repeat protein [Anaerolineales bacterium]
MRSPYFLTIVFAGLVTLTACGSTAARYNNQGNEAFKENNYLEALEDYTAAKQENPDLAEPYYNSGNTYYRQGQYESAEMQTKQSIRSTEREENQALAQNSYYNLGNSYFQTQQWSEAIDAYKEALRLNPDDQDAKYNLELALKNQEQEQQQQQQQGGGQPPPPEGQDQPNQGGQQGDQPNQGQNGDQDQQGGGGQPEQNDDGQSGSNQDQPQNSGGQRGLTPSEAEQLLDALGQDSQTLQERLQEGFFAPGLPPAEDW